VGFLSTGVVIKMRLPLEGGILGRRYNKTLHGRSIPRKQDVPGHNVILGYSRPGTGDGLDIFEFIGEHRGAITGVPVFAMHSGVVNRIVEPTGRLGCIYVAAPKLVTVYAHLHILEGLKLGQKIKEGQKLGHVGRVLGDPHLHFEMWVNGKAVTGHNPAEMARNIIAVLG
jgi:murein DD-endopeptidase MepM/ murein hydrolase activator NlpD